MCIKKKKNVANLLQNTVKKFNTLSYITNGFIKIEKTIKSTTSPFHISAIDNYINIYRDVAVSKINSIGNKETRQWLIEVLYQRLVDLADEKDRKIRNISLFMKPLA